MRIIITFVLAALIGLTIQASVVHTSAPAAVAPDFILILTVAIALFYHSPGGALGAFLLGMLADFASAQYVGPNAAGCVVSFVLVGLIANRVYADKVFAVFIIAYVCSLAKNMTALAMYAFYVPEFTFPQGIFRTMLLEALLSAVLAPIVLRMLRGRVGGSSGAAMSKVQTSPAFRWSS